MNDIEITPIPIEPSRLENQDRFYETNKKELSDISYSFTDIISCKLYDSTTQTPSTGTYTYQNITQTWWFTYVSWVLTIPKTSYYYVVSNCEVVLLNNSFQASYFTLNTGELLCDIYSSSYLRFMWLSRYDTNSNILKLEKGQTITVSYSQYETSSVKSSLYLVEINPLSVLLN